MTKATELAERTQAKIHEIWLRLDSDEPIASDQAKADIRWLFDRMRRIEALHEMESNYVDYMIASVDSGEWQERAEKTRRLRDTIDEIWNSDGAIPVSST